MSLRRIGKVVWRTGQQLLIRLKDPQIVRVIAKHGAPQTVQRAAQRLPLSKNAVVRMIQLTLRSTNKRVLARPFASLHLFKHLFNDDNRSFHRFRNFIFKKKKPVDVYDRIRNIFGSHQRYSFFKPFDEVPQQLDGYEIGSLIATGCNAAVYEIRKASDSREYAASNNPVLNHPRNRRELYPLALKVMFNYQYDLPEHYLWRDMGTELLPIPNPAIVLRGQIARFKPIMRSHPNIVTIHTAFIDRMPSNLPDSQRFPEALPNAPFYESIIDDPKTLFLVMKRYMMTLREYTFRMRRNYWTGRVIFGQLLEACVFLWDHTIAHRDIKSDNVLLEFDEDSDIPHAVLSDFGTAMSTGSWLLDYPDDRVDLGGNLALRAPEIRRAKPGPGVVVDFEKSDLWAMGTLGYEIFTRENPFYQHLKGHNYMESDLPILPRKLIPPIKQLLVDMLSVDAEKRPLPHLAATVVCMSLFRFGEDVRAFIENCGISMDVNIAALNGSVGPIVQKFGAKMQKTLDDVTALYAAETILARGLKPGIVSSTELQLRATFLARMDRSTVWQALTYFFH